MKVRVAWNLDPPYASELTVWETTLDLAGVPRVGDNFALNDVPGHGGDLARFVVDEVCWSDDEPVWVGLAHQPEECERHVPDIAPAAIA